MKKNIVASVVFGLILASFYPVEAQQPTRVRKIGFLNQTGAFSANIESFRQGMRELGYIEGQNIVIEFRSGAPEAQLTQLANELVQQKVELIVTSGPAVKRRLPSMFGRKELVEAGGLMSYGPSLEELCRRIPVHVDKILKGTKPADIPVEQPTKFEFIVNLKTAKQIGLTIPPDVLARADKVIK
jgi:ABC-type uncharacterized transport system substrate-binding protein